jgi:hypothetical protein
MASPERAKGPTFEALQNLGDHMNTPLVSAPLNQQGISCKQMAKNNVGMVHTASPGKPQQYKAKNNG